MERHVNRLYLDLAQVMLVATDRAGVVQLVNQRATRVLRKSGSQIVGSNWIESCVAPDDRAACTHRVSGAAHERQR
jgi:PAS domain-containing protein